MAWVRRSCLILAVTLILQFHTSHSTIVDSTSSDSPQRSSDVNVGSPSPFSLISTDNNNPTSGNDLSSDNAIETNNPFTDAAISESSRLTNEVPTENFDVITSNVKGRSSMGTDVSPEDIMEDETTSTAENSVNSEIPILALQPSELPITTAPVHESQTSKSTVLEPETSEQIEVQNDETQDSSPTLSGNFQSQPTVPSVADSDVSEAMPVADGETAQEQSTDVVSTAESLIVTVPKAVHSLEATGTSEPIETTGPSSTSSDGVILPVITSELVPEVVSEPELISQSEAASLSISEAVSEPEASSEPEAPSVTVPEAVTEPEAASVTVSEVVSEHEAVNEPEVVSEPEAASVPIPEAISEPEVTSEPEAASEPETVSVPIPEAVSDPEVVKEPEAVSVPIPEAVSEPEGTSKSEDMEEATIAPSNEIPGIIPEAVFASSATADVEPLSPVEATTSSYGTVIVGGAIVDEETSTSTLSDEAPAAEPEPEPGTDKSDMKNTVSDTEMEATIIPMVPEETPQSTSNPSPQKPVDSILVGGVPIGESESSSSTPVPSEMNDTEQPPDWITNLIDGIQPVTIDEMGTLGTELNDPILGIINVTANDSQSEVLPEIPTITPEPEEEPDITDPPPTAEITEPVPEPTLFIPIIPLLPIAMNETESSPNETDLIATDSTLLETDIMGILENMTDINETNQRPSELSKNHDDLTEEEQVNAVTVVFLIPVYMKTRGKTESSTDQETKAEKFRKVLDVYWYEERNQKFRKFVADAVNHHEAHGWNNLHNGSYEQVEGREYLGRSKRSTSNDGIAPEDLVYIEPSPSSENRTIFVAFFVRNSTADDADSLVPSYKVIHALKMSKYNLEETMGMNVTRIYQGIVLVKLQHFFVRHAMVFTILLAIAVACIFIIIIGLIYIRCRSTRGKWDRNDYCDKHKLKKDMRVSGEIGDLTPEDDIRKDEARQMSEKDGLPYLNGSGVHVIPMNDEEGWVVPYDELSPEEKDAPEVEDTKL